MVVLLDFFLNIIWLPIGVANTWGFRTAEEAFMSTYNGTGAPAGWNWCLSYLATAGILIGFDASGHVAEETKNASVTAARGIFWSTVVSGIGGLATIILFLFCAVCPPTYYPWSALTSIARRRYPVLVRLPPTICPSLRRGPGQGRPHLHEHHLRGRTLACTSYPPINSIPL